MGNAIACTTRWLTSGLLLHKWAWLWGRGSCEETAVLGEAQWHWLESQLWTTTNDNDDKEGQGEKPQVFIVLSSIQVWSTNPAMEGWGQFPGEQKRLWNLLQRHYFDDATTTTNNKDNHNTQHQPNKVTTGSHRQSPAPVIFLSGDVHHGEIIGQEGYLEVTSSGMTHHCGQPKLYGQFCQPILDSFHAHRHSPKDYYIGHNFGMIEINWATRVVEIQIRNHEGETVLQVQQPLDRVPGPLSLSYEDLPHTLDGHLLPYTRRILWTAAAGVAMIAMVKYLS
jgi:hypothetical protein